MTASSPSVPLTQRTARLVPQPRSDSSSSAPPQEVVHLSSFAIIRKNKKEEKILLAKRSRPQFTAGKWTLPSSLIDYGEDPEEAIKRIVEVQLGTRPVDAKLLKIESFGDKHWDLCFVYEVSLPGEKLGNLSQDVEKVEYFDLRNLPTEFRSDHREVLEAAGLV